MVRMRRAGVEVDEDGKIFAGCPPGVDGAGEPVGLGVDGICIVG
jgi:hypothetical protein